MRECDCPIPQDAGKNRPGYCRICGGRISPRIVSDDETFAEFFDQLADLPGISGNLIEHCRQRERAGRNEFGFKYLARDNAKESREEIADFIIYLRLALLRARREGAVERTEVALEAAYHAARAYELSWRL